MSIPYTVKSGGYLGKIALDHGFKDWREVYDHPDNAEFRRKRPDPNKIFPGDVLMIPTAGPSPSPTPPPTPPTPPTPNVVQPFASLSAARTAVTAYLTREAKREVATILHTHEANLIVFGEVHRAGDGLKADLLSTLVSRSRREAPAQTRFHASERFLNEQKIRDQISDFLRADSAQQARKVATLDNELKPFVSVLRTASGFPGRRFGVIPSNTRVHDPDIQKDEDLRHPAIFNEFVDACARCPDVPLRSISAAVSRGTFLLGARHAARKHVAGRATKTTCVRLTEAGWKTHAVRLAVPFNVLDTGVFDQEDLALRASAATGTIDLIQIADNVAGGSPFYADLTKDDSPFKVLRATRNSAADIPYNELFDALVFLTSS
jgi:hypothetical protein